jgi:hypothetical protein
MNNSRTSNNGTRINVACFPLKGDNVEVPKNLEMESVNLQCSTDHNQNFPDSKFQDFYSHLPKEKNFSTHDFQIQNDCDVLQCTYMYKQFLLF